MLRYDFVAIDFETANQRRASACSIGIAAVRDGRIETHSFLIRPREMHFDPVNISIHGITPDMVREAPLFGELLPTIRHFLDGEELWAHYAPFDAGVLLALRRAEGLALPAKLNCTCQLARLRLPALPSHRLPVVCAHLGIPLNHHDAASDAEACARIVLALNRRAPP